MKLDNNCLNLIAFASYRFLYNGRFRLEEFKWLRSTPPVEPQAPAQIEEKNGFWLDEIQWDWYL